jgi:hypothetical protein
MTQAEIDAFVHSALDDTLTPEGVTSAVVTRGIPVNGRHSTWGWTALHWAVRCTRCELVVALLAASASPNVPDNDGRAPVWIGAACSTADILQLLIDGGGNVNEVSTIGQTPLMAIVNYNRGDVAARLQVLLACPELDLDTRHDGKTAEQWAVSCGQPALASVIAQERARRERWSALRAAWIAATATLSVL